MRILNFPDTETPNDEMIRLASAHACSNVSIPSLYAREGRHPGTTEKNRSESYTQLYIAQHTLSHKLSPVLSLTGYVYYSYHLSTVSSL